MEISKKTAWIFSGGGARGAFQAGVAKKLLDHDMVNYGTNPFYVAGISVGALNGLAIACGKINYLTQIWHTIDNDQVYKKRNIFVTGLRLGTSRYRLSSPPKGLFSMHPLREYMNKHIKGWELKVPFIAGVVNVESGVYHTAEIPPETSVGDNEVDVVMASSAIPVTFEPVKITNSPYLPDGVYVDGGLKNMTPLRNILKLSPEHVLIVTCDRYNEKEVLTSGNNNNIIEIAQGSVSTLVSNSFMSDLRKYFQINEICKYFGGTFDLDGKIFKYYPTDFIEPQESLGDSLEFNPEVSRERFRRGAERVGNLLIKTKDE